MNDRLAALAAVLVVAGCASAGNMALRDETEQSVGGKIFEGKTTKKDVIALYGQPTSTTFTDGGNDIFTYRFAHATADGVSYVPIVGIFAGGANVRSKELVILFDKQDVVVKKSMRESEQHVKRGTQTPAN